MSAPMEALREARRHFIVEYCDGRVQSVGYDSEALRKIVTVLDTALAAPEQPADDRRPVMVIGEIKVEPPVPDKRQLAMAAAHQAVEAAAELMRFAREGEFWQGTLFCPEVEVLEKLCDAAKLAGEIVYDEPDPEGDRNRLYGALVKFLEGWA